VDYQVLVLADQGVYSPERFASVRQLEAHPLMRVNEDLRSGWFPDALEPAGKDRGSWT
jgi:hypothetical protein